MNARKVLLVSYHFPPLGGSGVQRALKLATYLPDAGWGVHVLTAGHRHYPLVDRDLSEGLNGKVRVHSVLGLEPGSLAAAACRWMPAKKNRPFEHVMFEDRLYWRLDRWYRYFRLPETEMLWIPAAVRAARRIITKHRIDAVVTTSPPHSTQWVGRALQRCLGIPWIADLRDPILDNFAYEPRGIRADRYWRWLERVVATKADRVVVTCPDLAERLQGRYAGVPASRYSIVTNGYDPADRPPASSVETPRRGRFVLGYVGSFYRAQMIGPILTAMRRLLAARPGLAGRLELRIMGSVSTKQRALLHDSDDAFLRLTGYQSHGDAVSQMAAADALFLMTPVNEGGRYCIPAKVFEYLAFGKHVIALVHDDTALARLLADVGNVTLISHGDLAALAQAIEKCHEAWTNGLLDRPRTQGVVELYRRDELAAAYARVLEQCLHREPATEKRREPTVTWRPA